MNANQIHPHVPEDQGNQSNQYLEAAFYEDALYECLPFNNSPVLLSEATSVCQIENFQRYN